MKLSGIEIKGFKSFCDTTRIQFGDNNLIAVIGPNGCGKSNVVDALRWVLGEQSAKSLRGQDMKDVIFAGTNNRPQSVMTSVTLQFDNFQLPESGQFRFGDFSEIAIGRRLYRNGASEYLINNTPSRLKDVRDIFLDTGVGGKGYSIIEQGMIGKIITCRPEDRLYIVEEAAGVLKFRVKKQEADRKLDSSKQNLLRINDLLSELTERETTLGRQVERAEKFIAAKSTVERLTGQLMAFRWHKVSEKNEQYKTQIEQDKQFQTDTLTNVSILENSLEKLRIDLIQCESSREEIYREIETLRQDISTKENDLKIRAEQIKNFKAWKERGQTDIEEIEKILEKNATYLETETEKREQAEEELALAQETFQVIADNRDTLKDKHAGLQTDKENTEKETHALKERLYASKVRLEQLQERLAEYKEELELMPKPDGHLDIDNGETQPDDSPERQISVFQTQIDECNEKLNGLQTDLENIAADQKKAETERQNLRQNLNRLETEHLKLKTVLETISVNNQSAKRLSEFMRTTPDQAKELGFLGMMSHLFKLKPGIPPEAIIVWEHFSEALVFSEYCRPEVVSGILKEIKADNVVLCFLKDQPASSPLLSDRYPDFFQYLEPLDAKVPIDLPGRIFTGPTDFNDLPESVLNKPVYWFNGDSLLKEPGGFIHFKNPGAHSALAKQEAHRQKMEILEKEMIQIKFELNTLDKKISRLTALSEELSLLKINTEEDYRRLEMDFSNFRIQLEEKEKRLHVLADISAENIKKQRAVSEKIQLGEQSRETLEEEIQGLENGLIQIETELGEKEQSVLKTASELNDTEEEWQELRLKKQELESIRANILDTVKRLQIERDETGTRLNKVQDEFKEKYENEEATGSTIEKIRAEIPKLLNILRQSEEQLIVRKNAVEFKKQEILEHETKKNSWIDKIGSSEKQKQSAELKQVEAQKEMAMMQENLQTLSGLHPKEIIRQMDTETFNESRTEKEIATQRDIISEIGNVNMEAFDEFKALTERLTFLNEQHADLTGSIAALASSIETLEAETKEKFNEAFNRINSNLKEIFPLFFGGGSAELAIVEAETEDKRGIEIMVNMPGKKMRNLNLLSGGEKAMSALALVFSIFMIKPSPFCMLDEVDAPLDEANVKRLCNVLKTFSEKIRFIVITHNKVTMEAADLLIGVTMGEPGVSKIVSVRMSDYAKMAQNRVSA